MAAGGTDGSLKFDTKIIKDGFVHGASTLKRAAAALCSSITRAGRESSNAFEGSKIIKLKYQIEQTESSIRRLQAEMQSISNARVESPQFLEVKKQISDTEKKLNSLKERQAEYLALGGSQNSNRFKRMQYEIEELTNSLKYAKGELADLEASEQQYVLADTGAIQQRITQISQLSGRLQELNARLIETEQKENLAGATGEKAWKSVKSGIQSVINSLKKLASVLTKKAVSGIKNFKSQFNGVGKASNRVSKSILKLSNMFKLMLIRMAMRAAIQGVKEGMQNLVQYSDSANKSMSNLMTGMTYLKNSFAAAFAPILTTIAPALNTLINLLVAAANAVNQFFSALGGGKTFVKAKKVNEDYADSISAAGGAAGKAGKEAKKALAPFDELNVITEQGSASGGSGGADPSQMFETVAIEDGISDFVNKLKKLYADGDYSGIGKLIGEKINESVSKISKYIDWGNCGKQITAFIVGFTDLFNKLVGTIDWNAIGRMFGLGVNTLANTLYLLLTKINWTQLGRALSNGLNGAVYTVNWGMVGNTIGAFFQAQISTLYSIVTTLDWAAIGIAFSTALTGVIAMIDWAMLGSYMANGLNGLFAVLLDFAVNFDWKAFGDSIALSLSTLFQDFNWAQAGSAISEFVIGLLDFLIAVVQDTDWAAFVQGVVDCIEAVNWIGLAEGIFTLLSSALGIALGALANLLGTLISDGIDGSKNYFQKKAEECGGNIWEGVKKGILDAVVNVFKWIHDNIFAPFMSGLLQAFGIKNATSEEVRKVGENIWKGFCKGIMDFFTEPGEFIKSNITDPFINGVKSLLGIHSPSTVMAGLGQYIWEGFCEGIKKFFANPTAFIKANITDPFLNGVKDLLGIHSPSREAFSIAEYFAQGFNNGLVDMVAESQGAAEKWLDKIMDVFDGTSIQVPVGLNIPNASTYLPRMAEGTIVPPRAGEFSAAYYTKYQSQKDQLEGEFTEIRRMLKDITGSRSEGGDIYLSVNLDGNVVYDTVVKKNQMAKKRTGKNPLLV